MFMKAAKLGQLT